MRDRSEIETSPLPTEEKVLEVLLDIRHLLELLQLPIFDDEGYSEPSVDQRLYGPEQYLPEHILRLGSDDDGAPAFKGDLRQGAVVDCGMGESVYADDADIVEAITALAIKSSATMLDGVPPMPTSIKVGPI